MKSLKIIFPAHLRFLLAVHVALLAIFSLFRYVMLVYNRPTYFFDSDRSISLSRAFWIGFKFDITVATYALFIPFFLLTLAYLKRIDTNKIHRFVRIYCGAAIIVSLAICAADVPYFKYYNARLNTATIHLKNMAQIIEFILKEIKYYPFVLAFILGLWGIGRLIKLLWNRTYSAPLQAGFGQKITASLLGALLLVVGLWGGIVPKRPDMRQATFSNDGFINQLTLNPVHTWFDSFFEFDIHIFGAKKARELTRKSLGIEGSFDTGHSPIERLRSFDQPERKMNVVLILMESMSADRMGIFGEPNNLTPNLDRLARNSVFFDQCFSNGIHTNAGIYSSLYGMPVMMMRHPMLNGAAEYTSFTGLPVTLQEKGYRTRFFCTHPKTFDNLDIFLLKNGFEHISDQFEYAADEVTNAWGVSDESLMSHAFGQIDSMANSDRRRPFFATVLTITTHPPYTMPANTSFKPRSTDPVLATYEYADWAIGSFIDSCATKDWYKNTIFVLVGDHGVNLPGYRTDVSLSYNHIPLIIHAPKLFSRPQVLHGMANQTDIYPTVMGLLRSDYRQNTIGYDLLSEKRPFAIFSQDNRMCAINDQFLYVARKSGTESLYRYKTGNPNNFMAQYRTLADSMQQFACAHLLVSQQMVENGQTK